MRPQVSRIHETTARRLLKDEVRPLGQRVGVQPDVIYMASMKETFSGPSGAEGAFALGIEMASTIVLHRARAAGGAPSKNRDADGADRV